METIILYFERTKKGESKPKSFVVIPKLWSDIFCDGMRRGEQVMIEHFRHSHRQLLDTQYYSLWTPRCADCYVMTLELYYSPFQ